MIARDVSVYYYADVIITAISEHLGDRFRMGLEFLGSGVGAGMKSLDAGSLFRGYRCCRDEVEAGAKVLGVEFEFGSVFSK